MRHSLLIIGLLETPLPGGIHIVKPLGNGTLADFEGYRLGSSILTYSLKGHLCGSLIEVLLVADYLNVLFLALTHVFQIEMFYLSFSYPGISV